jgi:hypothetical protein
MRQIYAGIIGISIVAITHTKNIMRHIDGMTIKKFVDIFPDAAEIWSYWPIMSFLGFEI